MTAFWDKLKGEKGDESAAKAADKKPAAKKPAKSKKVSPEMKEKAAQYSGVLRGPVISENAMNQQLQNKYVFQVSTNANKKEVEKAVETRYGVTVEAVNMVRYKQKSRNFRSSAGMMKGFKKAIVTVKQGEKIELFKEA